MPISSSSTPARYKYRITLLLLPHTLLALLLPFTLLPLLTFFSLLISPLIIISLTSPPPRISLGRIYRMRRISLGRMPLWLHIIYKPPSPRPNHHRPKPLPTLDLSISRPQTSRSSPLCLNDLTLKTRYFTSILLTALRANTYRKYRPKCPIFCPLAPLPSPSRTATALSHCASLLTSRASPPSFSSMLSSPLPPHPLTSPSSSIPLSPTTGRNAMVTGLVAMDSL